MPFLIRDEPTPSTFVVDELAPGPTEVDYPDYREYNLRTTQDSAFVIQRPIADARPRKWLWKRYRNTVPNYETQYDTLRTLEARQRHLDSRDPNIFIWENESDEGEFGALSSGTVPDLESYTNISWTQVKFMQVHRKSAGGGGPVIYEDSWVEFVITDPAWESF